MDIFAPRFQPAKMIYEALIKESMNRKFFHVDDWISNERIEVLRAVNDYCRKNDLKEVTIEDVMKAENDAYGHSDYMSKFATGVAEIIFLKNTIGSK